MKEDIVVCDYSILEDELVITSLNVQPKYRRKGYGTSYIQKLEKEAVSNNCTKISVGSDLSKIALSFWLKNSFNTDDVDDKKKIKRVLNSNKPDNYIFDLDDNSTVDLIKSIC